MLISVDDVAAALDPATRGEDPPPVLLDVRWSLGGPPGWQTYLTGHLPGAVYVDLDTELAGHGEPTDGRHPLPSITALQRSARRWGIDQDSPVVVYDGFGNLAAARAWWLLRWAGLTDVRLLDGALPAWRAAGLALQVDDVRPAPGSVRLTGGALPTLALGEVGDFATAAVLLDARAAERFEGLTEPVDPRAGHVPGARNVPTAGNLTEDGAFLPADRLRERFAAAGALPGTRIGVYCGSGVTAAHEIAALAVAGLDAELFPGSWSQWSNNDLPVATGARPVPDRP